MYWNCLDEMQRIKREMSKCQNSQRMKQLQFELKQVENEFKEKNRDTNRFVLYHSYM